MSAKELRELDAWIASLMEQNPSQLTLRAVRGKDDHQYNYAQQESNGGWWVCETGSDAENKHLGDLTLCVWEPRFKIASEPEELESRAAAMEVLKNCADKVGSRIHIYPPLFDAKYWMISDCEAHRTNQHDAHAETLELAIALFAKKIFSK